MKRILLTTVLLVAVYQLFSQNLTLSYHQGPMDNGDSVLINGDVNSFMEAHVFVKNTGTGSLDVKCKKTEISIIHGTENTFCWGQCYGSTTYVSLESVTIGAGQSDTINFVGDYNPAGNWGVSIILYTFFDESNPNDSVAMKVFYNAGCIGISEMSDFSTISKIYPNPADDFAFVNYSYNASSASASFVICNANGQKVQEYGLNSGSGRVMLDLSGLNPGLYFCSLVVDGKIEKSEKLIVR